MDVIRESRPSFSERRRPGAPHPARPSRMGPCAWTGGKSLRPVHLRLGALGTFPNPRLSEGAYPITLSTPITVALTRREPPYPALGCGAG
jgi:hypothetical protein